MDPRLWARLAGVVLLAMLVPGLAATAANAPRRAWARVERRRAPATFAAAGCPREDGLITQSMSGRVSGCLRLGALAPGPHTVVLLQVPNVFSGPPARPRQPAPRPVLTQPPEPAVTLSLSPTSGGPGTVVTITGRTRSQLRQEIHTAPIAQVSDGLAPIAADPLDPSTVAWCSGDAVKLSSPSATTSIPTAGAVPALQQLGFHVQAAPPLACQAVAAIDTPSGSLAGIAAAFPVQLGSSGPPFYEVALATYDRGQSWTGLPVPVGASRAGFGGFRYTASGALQAVFAAAGHGGSPDFPALDANRPFAAVTTDAGHSWQGHRLGCPTSGPCVTLGPFIAGNCAMNGELQPLLRSTDGGLRWGQPELPGPIDACGEGDLVATTAGSALLVDALSPYPGPRRRRSINSRCQRCPAEPLLHS